MRTSCARFLFGVVLRRHPETCKHAIQAAEKIIEAARRENEHPERIEALEEALTFLRSPPT